MKQRFSVLIAALFISISTPAQNFDINTLKAINKTQSNFKDDYLKVCTYSVKPLSIAAPVAILTAGLIKHDKKLQQDALYMAGSYVASAAVTYSIKKIVNRQRPFEKYAFIVKRYDEKDGLSFPSGHTSAAFCVATSLSIRYPKWYVIAPSFIYAGSAGWARMYQGVHYPSDVFVGAIVGAGSALVGYKVQRWMDKKSAKDKMLLTYQNSLSGRIF
jgi:membrane-associated phospholipid phosphatase